MEVGETGRGEGGPDVRGWGRGLSEEVTFEWKDLWRLTRQRRLRELSSQAAGKALGLRGPSEEETTEAGGL